MARDFDIHDLDILSSLCECIEEQALKTVKDYAKLQQDMSDMLIWRFQNNLEAFKKYMPDVYRNFKDYRPQETLQFFCGPDGIPNLMIGERREILYKALHPYELCTLQVEHQIKEATFRQVKYDHEGDPFGQIHHRYMNMAVDVIEKINIGPADRNVKDSVPMCIVLGVGLGYPLGLMYERLEIANLVLVEPKLDIFYASMHAFDWASLLEFLHENNYGLQLCLGQNEDEIFADIANFYGRHGRFLSGFCWIFCHYLSREMGKIHQAVNRDYNRLYSAMGFFDDHLFGISNGAHLIYDKKGLANREPLPQKWKDTPCFVVGNGPSLDKDIAFLRKNQDKAVILACGTALETLYRAGIQADFYAVTERVPYIDQTLELIGDKSYLDKVVMLASDVIHPKVASYFKHCCIFGKSDEPFYHLLYSRYPMIKQQWEPIGRINPLVSNCGTSAALTLGFRRIYLFGVDNGMKFEKFLTPHSVFSEVYGRAKYEIDDVEKFRREHPKDIVPGNFGTEIYSNPLYRLSRRFLELAIKENQRKASVYNCSDGAAIEGAYPLRSEKMNFDIVPAADKNDLFLFMTQKKTFVLDTGGLTPKEFFLYDDFDYMVDVILKCIKERPRDRIKYVQMLEQAAEVVSSVAYTRDRFMSMMIDGTLDCMFILALYCLYRVEDERNFERADEILDIFEMFLHDAKIMYRLLPDFLMGEHGKHTDGKVGFDHGEFKAYPIPPLPTVVPPEKIEKAKGEHFVKLYE